MFKEFIDAAKELAERMYYKHAQLDQEENKLRKRLDEIKEERSKFSEINVSIEAYNSCGGIYPCPKCFVTEGRVIEMTPLGSESSLDIFRCLHCNLELKFEV